MIGPPSWTDGLQRIIADERRHSASGITFLSLFGNRYRFLQVGFQNNYNIAIVVVDIRLTILRSVR
jgi:hypothetical protein